MNMYACLTEVTITPVEEGMPPAVAIPTAFTVLMTLADLVWEAGRKGCCMVESCSRRVGSSKIRRRSRGAPCTVLSMPSLRRSPYSSVV